MSAMGKDVTQGQLLSKAGFEFRVFLHFDWLPNQV